MPEVKRIVVIGPESTGKSTLCAKLAEHYNTLWCREYAREYLIKNGPSYTYEDLLEIAKGQVKLEEEYVEKVRNTKSEVRTPKYKDQPQTINYKLLFVDTNMYVMKVWSEYVFNKCHQYIIDEIVKRPYDLYLLMDIDLPWTKDDLREYPDYKNREMLYHMYKDILVNQQVPWFKISGTNEQRLLSATHAIDSHFIII